MKFLLAVIPTINCRMKFIRTEINLSGRNSLRKFISKRCKCRYVVSDEIRIMKIRWSFREQVEKSRIWEQIKNLRPHVKHQKEELSLTQIFLNLRQHLKHPTYSVENQLVTLSMILEPEEYKWTIWCSVSPIKEGRSLNGNNFAAREFFSDALEKFL